MGKSLSVWKILSSFERELNFMSWGKTRGKKATSSFWKSELKVVCNANVETKRSGVNYLGQSNLAQIKSRLNWTYI